MQELNALYDIVKERKNSPMEGSYTCYLFEQGLDKILKKVAEESGEVIIAAKNKDAEPLCGEICDLLYHLIVLLVQAGASAGASLPGACAASPKDWQPEKNEEGGPQHLIHGVQKRQGFAPCLFSFVLSLCASRKKTPVFPAYRRPIALPASLVV